MAGEALTNRELVTYLEAILTAIQQAVNENPAVASYYAPLAVDAKKHLTDLQKAVLQQETEQKPSMPTPLITSQMQLASPIIPLESQSGERMRI